MLNRIVILTACFIACTSFIRFSPFSDVSTTLMDTGKSAPQTYAMIIGISNYKYIRPLTYADKDAELFRDFLKSVPGGKLPLENMFCLLNEEAKAGNFWVKGMEWIRSRNMKSGDRLYIYMAGHGDAINSDEYFFLTYDCNPAGDKNNYLVTGNIQLYNLKSRIADYVRKGVEVLLIMDACRTNELPGGTEGQQTLSSAISERKTGEMLMLATGAGQESLEDASIGTGHGLFTYYLIDGLSGLADANGDANKMITFAELETYINLHVPKEAENRFSRKQNPYFCCAEFATKNIVQVDSSFLNKWSLVKALKEISGSEMDAMARSVKARAGNDYISDSILLTTYHQFTKAIKQVNLTGTDSSAENYFLQLAGINPDHFLTKDARLTLASEFINFAQTKINLYLQGKDALAIQQMRSQFDDNDESEETNSALERIEKIARLEFTQVGSMLEKSIGYLDKHQDSVLISSIIGKVYFFKAHGFFDKGNKTMDFPLAMKYAWMANAKDTSAAYVYNTIASLYTQVQKYDSAIYYAEKSLSIAPRWRYPFLNAAYAYSKLGNKQMAGEYYRKAISIDPNNADAYVDLGRFYYANRELDSAQQSYTNAIRLDPVNVYANNNLGWLLKEKRQFAQAVSHFTKSIESDPFLFSSYNGLSKVYSEQRRFDSARYYYEKALQRYPDKMITTNFLGNFYKGLKQYDSAIIYYRQAVQYDREDNIPLLNIGNLFAELKQYDSAMFYYNQALLLKGISVKVYNQLGLLYKRFGKMDSAAVYFRKAYESDENYMPAINNLGLIYSDQKKFDSAILYYRKALAVNPVNAYLHNNLALSLKGAWKLNEAKYHWAKAIQLNPGITSAYSNLGWLYREQKNFDSAKYYFKEGLDRNPYNMDAMNNLIMLYKYLRQYDSAKIYFEQNIARYPGNPSALNNLGNFYSEIKNHDSALVLYQRAIALDPGYALAYNNIGTVYNDIAFYDSALHFYRKAISLDPAYTNAYFNAGMSFYNKQKYDSAIHYLDKAIQLNPKINYQHYFLACCYALKKMPAESLSKLQTALELGYNDYYNIMKDEDLKSIRNTKEFQALVKKYVPEKHQVQQSP